MKTRTRTRARRRTDPARIQLRPIESQAKIPGMELGTVLIGAAAGGVIGLVKGGSGEPLKYALWGGGVGLAASFLGIGVSREGGGFRVGQLPFSLPEPALPGKLVYNVDPRRDPLLDPVSRRQLLPAWLLLHWQNGDPKVIAEVQQALGVPADGVVGGGTLAAIRAFQIQSGLQRTGDMDRMTLAALFSA